MDNLESVLNSEDCMYLMKLHNTLTKKNETFKPLKGKLVKMYTCGPTVYGPLHLGHVRTSVAYDALREYLQNYKGFDVLHVQNITDVGHIVGDADAGEDKIEKTARERQIHPMELVDTYIQDMWQGYDALKCARPNIAPRATGHIVEIQDWCQGLIDKGFAYEADGDVYFDISKAKDYGILSGNRGEGLKEGARVEVNRKKRNPADFALWKKAEPNHILQWTSPWGRGYPGWHIECSVMSEKYLGVPFDIHGGARELAFPHHENEIAQSIAYTGKKPANFWVHTGLLLTNGEKMAKSAGNFVTVKDALKEHTPEQLRWFILANQYSSTVDYSKNAINASSSGLERINNFLFTLKSAKPATKNNPALERLVKDFSQRFEKAMDDDLNTPRAFSEIYTFVSAANKYLSKGDVGERDRKSILEEFEKIDKVFKSFNFGESAENSGSEDINCLIQRRIDAKSRKDWAEADRIRDELKGKGVELLDQKDGRTIWKKA